VRADARAKVAGAGAEKHGIEIGGVQAGAGECRFQRVKSQARCFVLEGFIELLGVRGKQAREVLRRVMARLDARGPEHDFFQQLPGIRQTGGEPITVLDERKTIDLRERGGGSGGSEREEIHQRRV
jgi:hypothetical protein